MLLAALALAASTSAVRYDLDVVVAPAERRLTVSGTIEVPPERRETLTLRLRSAMTLTSPDAEVTRGAAKGGVTEWTLHAPATLHFSASASDIHDQSLLHVGADSAFTTANEMPWYPLIAGTNSVGTLRVHAPPGWTVAAPGTEREPGSFSVGVPLRFWFAAAPYTVIAGKTSSAYLLKMRPGIAEDLPKIDAILRVLSDEFGPYPYGRFRLVEVPRAAAVDAGGFNAFGSAGSIVTRSSAFDVPFNTAYYAHEIGHQWWSNLVALRFDATRGNYMFDEAMAQYASMRAVEALEGEAAAERYRRTGYPGFHDDLHCYCAAGYFRMAAAGQDRPLVEMPDDSISDRLSRNKGAWTWFMLSDEIGHERFRQILHDVTRSHAFGEITWDEFLAAAARGAGRDLGWFAQQWFERTGAPEFSLDWQQHGGAVRVTIRQHAPFYRATIDVELRGAAASKRTAVAVSGAETTIDIPAPFEVLDAALDPGYRILRWTPELRAQAAASAPYLMARQSLAAAEPQVRAALAALPSPDPYGARFFASYALGMIDVQEKRWTDAVEHLRAAIATPVRSAELVPYVYLRLAAALKALGDVEAARRAVADGLSASTTVDAREALNALGAKLGTP